MSGLDLYQTQGALLAMLAWSSATGFCLGVVYDLLRVLRIFLGLDQKQGNTPLFRVVFFVEDVLMAVTATVALILLCYYTNDGLLRAPAVWGMAGGFFVYMQTVGRLTVRIERALSRLLGSLLRPVLRWLCRPLVWMIGAVRGMRHALHEKVVDKWNRKKQRRQVEEQEDSPTEPSPFKGTTVFSTRR